MYIALALAMDANLPARLGDGIVAGEDRAAVSITTKGLAGEETGATDGAQVAALAALVFGTETLGCIFDNNQFVLVSNGIDFVHVARLAIKTDGHDGLGARCDRGFDLGYIDIAGIGFDIHEHRLGAKQHDDFCSCYKSKRSGDDFVTGLNAHCHQADQQGLGATGHGDAMLGARVGLQLLLQLAHFGAHDVLAVLQHLVHARLDGIFQSTVLGLEIDEGNRGAHVYSAFVQMLFSRR